MAYEDWRDLGYVLLFGVGALIMRGAGCTWNDITDRKYVSLGDIEVTVKKWTIFDKDPTPALVDDALRAKAAQMGADAVILVRYGTVGIGFWSWGQLDGQGRAVVFQR